MTGTVHSCTTLHRGFPGFAVPFTVAWLDLPTGERALARAAIGCDDSVRPGDQVEVDHDPNADVLTFVRLS